MNRYFLTNDGIGQFLAGFGQRQDQVHAAEAGQQAANDARWGQVIGQGLQTAGGLYGANLIANNMPGISTPMQRMALGASLLPQTQGLSNMAGDMSRQDSTWQQAQQLENLRSGNDAMQQAMARSSQVDQMLSGFSNKGVQQGGGMQGMDGGVQPIGTNMDSSPMMPEQPPQSPGFPLPSIDPSMTQAYRKADQAIADLTMKRREVYAGSLPPMEKAAALYQVDSELMRNAQVRGRYQQPKPPTSEQELVQAGMVIPSDNGGNWYQSAPGKWSYANPPAKTLAKDGVDVSWPDGTTTKSTPGSHSKIIPEYGLVTVDVDTNGNTQTRVTQPMDAKDGSLGEQLSDELKELRDIWKLENKDPQPGKPKTRLPTYDDARKSLDQKGAIVEGYKQDKADKPLLDEVSAAIGIGRLDVMGDAVAAIREAHPNPATMSPKVQGEYARLIRNIKIAEEEALPGPRYDTSQAVPRDPSYDPTSPVSLDDNYSNYDYGYSGNWGG